MKISISNKTKDYIFVVAGIIITYIIMHLPYLLMGVSFLKENDDLTQYYTAIVKSRQYMVDMIKGLIYDHNLRFRLWDMSLGLGNDAYVVLHYYGISSPLMLLSLLYPVEESAKVYNLIFFVGIVLQALSISVFGKNKGWDRYQILAAALIYCFMAHNMSVARGNLCFIYPSIFFPLMVLGVDYLFERKRPWVYILSTVAIGWTNFYFFYASGILIILYVFYKLIFYKDKSFKEKLKITFGDFFVSSLVALAITAVVIIPVLAKGMGSDRALNINNLRLLYDREFYIKYFISILGYNKLGWIEYFGFTIVFVISGFLTFFSKREKFKNLRRLMIITMVFTLIPFIGLVLSSFTYPTNRWIWAMGLVAAAIVAVAVPEFITADNRKRFILFTVAVVFCGISIITPVTRGKSNVYLAVGSVIISVMLLYGVKIMKSSFKPMWICICVLCSVLLANYCRYYIDGLSDEYLENTEAYDEMLDEDVVKMLPVEDEPYRVDYACHSVHRNSPTFSNYYAINGYYSLQEPSITTAEEKFGNILYLMFNYADLDGRTILDRIFGVKYYIVEEDNEDKMAYGFYPMKKGAETSRGYEVDLYKTDQNLPFGFTYDKVIKTDDFEKMDFGKRQEALMYGAVTDGGTLAKIKPEYTSKNILKNIEANENIAINNNTFTVIADEASCVMNIDKVENSEIYLYFSIEDPRIFTEEEKVNLLGSYDEMTEEEKEDYQIEVLKDKKIESTRFGVSAYDMEIYRNVDVFTKYSEFDSNKTEYFTRVGYFDEGPEELRLHFSDIGNYTFKDIKVYAQNMETVDEQTEKLKEHTIHDLKFDTNTVTGRIEVPDKRLLFMSIPYSKGWKAYVDGVETEVHQTNVLGLGIELEPGEHEVVFKYFTPYLKEGAVISLIGLIGFIAIMILYNRDRKKSQKD